MDNPKPTQPPELEIEPAGEANTTDPVTLPINDAVEPPQTEAVQSPTELIPTQETPQNEPLSEPLQPTPETPTPHLPADEALAETAPEATPQGADLIHADVVGQEAPAEASKVETPTNTAESENLDSGSEAGMTMPAPRIPETGTGTEATPITTPPQNILLLFLTKARLVTQLRKQKKHQMIPVGGISGAH